MKEPERPNIVSLYLAPEAKSKLDEVCAKRGMSVKTLLGRLIGWFVELDKTEQSIVLGQVEDQDVKNLAELLLHRGPRRPAAAPAGKGPGRARKPPRHRSSAGSA